MNERDVPDEHTDRATETPTSTRPDTARPPTDKLSPPTAIDDDTEGHGGKVFAVDQVDAEGPARD